NLPEAGAFLRTRPELDAPDIEFHFSPSMFYDEGLTAPHAGGYCFGPVVVKPTSRGKVMLRAPIADSKPRILCHFLTTDRDRQACKNERGNDHDRREGRGPDRRAHARAHLTEGERLMSITEQTVEDLLDEQEWTGKIFSDGWVDAPETIETTEPATGDVLGTA